MNKVARKWGFLLARILALTLVLMPMALSLTEAKESRGNDLRSGSRSADFNVTEEVDENNPSALLNSQSLFDFSNIKRSTYSVLGSHLEIGIEWAEGHDFDIWCGQANSYEADCDNHEFQVDLGNGITIDKISSIDMWEEYLTIHIELGENVVECNQVINVSYQPSGRSSMGDPPDVPFSIEVLPNVDWLDQYDLQIKIKQDYLSYVEFMDNLKGLSLLEWYLTYINDLRVSEDGQHQLEFRIKPKLECLPSQVEHSIDLKVYTTDQYSLKLTPDQLKFAESDSDSLTLTFSNENSSDYQEFSIVAVDDEWAEKSSIAFIYIIVENENKIIENIGDLGDVTPFLVSAIFLEDNDEVIQVQPSPSVIKPNALQKFSFSLKAPLDEVSDTYVLVTLQGDKGRLLDPSYAEESSANVDVEGFVRDYILYKISDDTWGAEEYTFFVQTMDEGNANLHFLTFNDEFLNIIAHSFDSLFANGQKYLSGQFPKLTEFNFNSPINCSANQDCIFSLLPHFLLFQLVNEWVNSFMDLDDFLIKMRQEESQFNTFISHYPFPDGFNFFQLFDDIGGIEFTIINYMQFKIRDSSDPYLGIKHTERIGIRHPKTGGGGGSAPGSTDYTTIKIIGELEIDGDNPIEKVKIEIERRTDGMGRRADVVYLTQDSAREVVAKSKKNGNTFVRIVLPDEKDEVDEVTVRIPKQFVQLLRDNGLNFEIVTNNAYIAIPQSSLNDVESDFYFHLAPVKKESERKQIEERARVEQVVRAIAGNEQIQVVARPMTIETNLSSRPVTLTLPLKGVVLPTNPAERQAYLNGLGVFIEHSDGEKEVVFGEVVTMANGELGIRFSIDKFSTFTIINFGKELQHYRYIQGFPDGLFKPEQAVTRAQVAAMLARNLGYTGAEQTSIVPFPDVDPSHYASGVIRFVKEAGLMTGDPNGHFRPNDTITRAEMATVVANYKQLTIATNITPSFNDTKGHWAEAIIEASREAGLVTGYENGQFRPNGSLTRAEAVVMMNRVFERGPLHGVTTPSFPDVRPNHWAFKDIEEAAKTHQFYIDENGKENVVK